MSQARPRRAIASPYSRSRVGNGSQLFIEDIDQRSAIYRRFKEVTAQLTQDIGGDPSEAQLQIIRRAASLSVWCEAQECELAKGAPFPLAEFTTASNSLRRLLADLGIERRQRDVTPSLEQYLASKARADLDEVVE